MCFSDNDNKDIFKVNHNAPAICLFVNSSGNVLIGTLLEFDKLTVMGNKSVSGNICANGNLLATQNIGASGAISCTGNINTNSGFFRINVRNIIGSNSTRQNLYYGGLAGNTTANPYVFHNNANIIRVSRRGCDS